MFNFVNRNPFGKKIESAVSTGGEKQQKQQGILQQNYELNYGINILGKIKLVIFNQH